MTRTAFDRLTTPPDLAAIVCTRNRSALLRRVLQSLADQTLDRARFEVIVVDDGSDDDTPLVVRSFESALSIVYTHQAHSGLAAAKNHGTFRTASPLVLYLDDDDVAGRELLEAHLAAHRRHAGDNVAILGYTGLEAAIANDPLMRFVTQVEYHLFAYPLLRDGDVNGFDFFWGGRTSCKRSFLLRHGLFNPVFTFGCEDIELGYRLSRHNLRVVYDMRAQHLMTRAIPFDAFCDRLVRQGRSNFIFSQLHDSQPVRSWTEVDGAAPAWRAVAPSYATITASARHLDRMARLKESLGFTLERFERDALHRSYSAAFRASKLKGICEGVAERDAMASENRTAREKS